MSWTDERGKVLGDVKKLEPSDRLGLYSALIKMNLAMFESVRGWDSWLRNPTFMETFGEDELKDIYANFKETCQKFLEEDIKWTSKKETSLPKTVKAERSDSERRYT